MRESRSASRTGRICTSARTTSGGRIFNALGPFPECETIERHYRDNLFVVMEIYPMKNGHFYVSPYVQTGLTSSGTFTRRVFHFGGEFETRES